MVLTSKNIIEELEKKGSFSELLRIEDFAEEGKVADQLAREFRKSLKPTQLRRIFHAIKEVERNLKEVKKDHDKKELTSQNRSRIFRLLPELAYARGRLLIPQTFYRLMRISLGTEKLKTVKDLRVFIEFLTAILAYHKYHEKEGGKL